LTCEGEEHVYGGDAGTRALSLSHTCGHTGRARTVLDWVVTGTLDFGVFAFLSGSLARAGGPVQLFASAAGPGLTVTGGRECGRDHREASREFITAGPFQEKRTF